MPQSASITYIPYITSSKYPYTTEWRNPAGKIFGRIVPKIDEKYSHLFEEECFLSDDVEVRECVTDCSVLDISDI